ncbi:MULTISPECIES: cytochrome b [unclassified Pseudoclavibacter]|uniref:cytochrome bc1 complex cytochrome b subunit n=1 Tax=unclassified Pseudoclavibacter TaxID=2615177 RepID=UPI001CE3BF08|nr:MULTISPECIES: ubiquinol-cytochrome c reductase cytochrome b subunit [unclassified Pseudoclavibacter]
MTTTVTTKPTTKAGRAADYLDERLGVAGVVKEFGRKIFPDHWSFMLGEVALYSFVALLISGTFLTLFFQASMVETTYDGSYIPLKGIHMSAAYASTLDLSFDIRGGLLMRQLHHWSALMFVAAATLHMARIFFTGAFRKPRELNWIVGVLLWVLGMGAGFTGYSLPDDLLSGNGLRIIDGLMKGLPLIGTWLSFLFFGNEFPGTDLINRLYMLHIMLIPALIILLIAVHLLMVVLHKHTHYPNPGARETNVVGYPVLPVYAAKAGGFFFIVYGLLTVIAATFTINPIWNYGPYDPSPVSAGTQPDWYIGWADGALRLIPPHWESVIFGFTFSWNIMAPVVLLGGFIAVLVAYPFVEKWITGDDRNHNVLDRPRNAPTRTAIGAAGIAFYATMWAAASSDVMSVFFHWNVFLVTHVLQASLILGPIIAFIITRRVAFALQRKDRDLVLHGVETGHVIRYPHGEFQELHRPLDEYERWRLVSFEENVPVPVRPRSDGKIYNKDRRRSWFSRFFFESRVKPVTPEELAAAQHEHH